MLYYIYIYFFFTPIIFFKYIHTHTHIYSVFKGSGMCLAYRRRGLKKQKPNKQKTGARSVLQVILADPLTPK